MKNSLFFDELQEPFVVSLLTVEYHASLITEGMSDEDILLSFRETLQKTCGVQEPGQRDIEFLLSKFEQLNKPAPSEGQAARGRSLGSSFFDYVGRIDTVQLLGLMTNYDTHRMRVLYCKTDFLHVRDLMMSYTEFLREQQIVNFEAVMYGMGNSYKDDNATGSKPIDANSKEGLAMMRQFGVGDVKPEHLDQLGINLAFEHPGVKSSGPASPA